MTDSIWAEQVFAEKYSKGSDWGGHSGGGSSVYHSIPYKAFLESFIHANSISTVLDCGCGDWQFSRYLNYGAGSYYGYDIVKNVVERNQKLYGSGNRKFALMPASLDELPTCDLLILKDVLQHLPNQKIQMFIDRLFPRFRFCLITNSFEKLDTAQNTDIFDGDFRCLDLTSSPFGVKGAYVCEFGSSLWERIRTLLICH